jgi:hypothetical protein
MTPIWRPISLARGFVAGWMVTGVGGGRRAPAGCVHALRGKIRTGNKKYNRLKRMWMI